MTVPKAPLVRATTRYARNAFWQAVAHAYQGLVTTPTDLPPAVEAALDRAMEDAIRAWAALNVRK